MASQVVWFRAEGLGLRDQGWGFGIWGIDLRIWHVGA